jgi:hypothetical protein
MKRELLWVVAFLGAGWLLTSVLPFGWALLVCAVFGGASVGIDYVIDRRSAPSAPDRERS